MYCVAIETEEDIIPDWIFDILLKEDWRLLLSWDRNIWFKEGSQTYESLTRAEFGDLYYKYPSFYEAIGQFCVINVDKAMSAVDPPDKLNAIEMYFEDEEILDIKINESMIRVTIELSEERYKELRELSNRLGIQMYILEQGMWAKEYTKYKLFFEDSEKE